MATNDTRAAVIVAAPEGDHHGDLVLRDLRAANVDAVRLTADSFAAASVRWSPGAPLHFFSAGRWWTADEQTTVWWRRPGIADTGTLCEAEARLVVEEIDVLLPGLLEAVGVRWVDAPWVLKRARLKPLQLALAGALGVSVPPTLVTGDPEAAIRFAASDALAKSASTGRGIAPFVAPVPATEMHRVRTCPTTLQRPVEAAADARIVTIGSAAHRWTRSREADDHLDWRSVDPGGTSFSYAGCEDGGDAVAIASALGLSVSVQDWLVTDERELFLEVNPQGQWLFLSGADRILVPPMAAHLTGRTCDG